MGNFTLGRYLPLDSPVHKMDPRAKIIAMLVMLIAVFIPAGWIGYGVIFVVAASTILISKLSFGYLEIHEANAIDVILLINHQCICNEDRRTITNTWKFCNL